jgi:ABC-type amino acid transport substrate-binding protein
MTSIIHFRSFLACAALMLGICHGLKAARPDGGEQPDSAAVPTKALTVCAIPASMPRADKTPDGSPQGLDVAVAQHVGRILGRGVEFHWCASAECAWNCLPAGRCEMIVGLPIASGPQHVAAWSVPYAGAQFGLVVPIEPGGVRSLVELRGKRVGIVAGTVSLSENDHEVVRFKSREALLEGFRAAALNGAFLDADFAAWFLRGHPRFDEAGSGVCAA